MPKCPQCNKSLYHLLVRKRIWATDNFTKSGYKMEFDTSDSTSAGGPRYFECPFCHYPLPFHNEEEALDYLCDEGDILF